jgi:hypothetical protein
VFVVLGFYQAFAVVHPQCKPDAWYLSHIDIGYLNGNTIAYLVQRFDQVSVSYWWKFGRSINVLKIHALFAFVGWYSSS